MQNEVIHLCHLLERFESPDSVSLSIRDLTLDPAHHSPLSACSSTIVRKAFNAPLGSSSFSAYALAHGLTVQNFTADLSPCSTDSRHLLHHRPYLRRRHHHNQSHSPRLISYMMRVVMLIYIAHLVIPRNVLQSQL